MKLQFKLPTGLKENLKKLKQGILAYVTDTEEVVIGGEDKNIPLKSKYDRDETFLDGLNTQNVVLGKSHYTKTRKPMMVIGYDDGFEEDYTQALPIHQTYGVPAVTHIVSERIGEDGNLNVQQLKELEQAVWEIAAHTKRHNGMGIYDITQSISVSDTKIYTDRAGVISSLGEKGYVECLIEEGETSEIVNVIGDDSDANGAYVTIETGVDNSYTTSATIRLTNEEMEYELFGCKDDLRKIGFNPKNHGWTYGDNCRFSMAIASKFYNSARAISNGLNPKSYDTVDVFETFKLNAPNFEEDKMTDTELTDLMDDAVANDKLLLLYGHPASPEMSEARIEYAIQEAQARDIEIVTMEKALQHFGNSIEKVGYGSSVDSRTEALAQHFAVDNRGNLNLGVINFSDNARMSAYLNDQFKLVAKDKMIIESGSRIRFNLENKDYVAEFNVTYDNGNSLRFYYPDAGIICTTPDGTEQYKISVDNNGDVKTELV